MTNDLDPRHPGVCDEGACPGEGPPQPARTAWFLAGPMNPSERVRHVPVPVGVFLVGRGNDNALCLSNRTVSKTHAELVATETSLAVRDLASTNGTYVNGERLRCVVELAPDDLVQFGDAAFRVLKDSSSQDTGTLCEDVTDRAMALVQFDRLMTENAVVPYYQPIVDLRAGNTVVGFEVLARSGVRGLETPERMFSTAAQLGQEVPLSRMVRGKAIEESSSLPTPPHVFLNTHPKELDDPGLIESMRSLRELSGSQRMTLEIHERAITDAAAMRELRGALRDLDVRLAFDDFGAGEARLVEVSRVQPDYIKFDISLVRALHEASPEHRQMLAALVRMVQDMAVLPVAEGVACEAECAACVELGFELAQGFYFGKPHLLGI